LLAAPKTILAQGFTACQSINPAGWYQRGFIGNEPASLNESSIYREFWQGNSPISATRSTQVYPSRGLSICSFLVPGINHFFSYKLSFFPRLVGVAVDAVFVTGQLNRGIEEETMIFKVSINENLNPEAFVLVAGCDRSSFGVGHWMQGSYQLGASHFLFKRQQGVHSGKHNDELALEGRFPVSTEHLKF